MNTTVFLVIGVIIIIIKLLLRSGDCLDCHIKLQGYLNSHS